MIKDNEKYHGVVFARLTHINNEIKISSKINNDNNSYIINDKIGIYVKYSKKRLTPWLFTFNKEQYSYVKKLILIAKNGYVVLVCNNDGICCVDFKQFLIVINKIDNDQTKSINITRYKNQMYEVSGTDGKINQKVADSMFVFNKQ